MKQLKYFFAVVLLTFIFVQTSNAGRYFNSWIARWTIPDPLQQKYPGWSPYVYGLDNPIKNIDIDGNEVHVYTERLTLGVYSNNAIGMLANLPSWIPGDIRAGMFGLGAATWELIGPRHSFMEITAGGGIDKMIELGGPLQGHTEGNPLTSDVNSSFSPRPGQEEEVVQRPSGVRESDFSFENKILEINTLMSNYIIENHLPIYSAFGLNSNGYIAFLIAAAGGTVSLPANAFAKDKTDQYWQIYRQLLDQEKNKKNSHSRVNGIDQNNDRFNAENPLPPAY